MIELGLARISRLLQNIPIPWKAIHVAGTNGKGSVCAYVSAILQASDVRCGRFTSPHLIDRWDCITINEEVVEPDLFHEVEAEMKAKDVRNGIRASEFEILTATAFEVFNRKNIEVGVVEVGLGGRQDATNVLQKPATTVITKISEDHQSILGETLEEIAYQKAGIMKPQTPCFVDGTNPQEVIDTLKRNAESISASPISLVSSDIAMKDKALAKFLESHCFETHQLVNIQLAIQTVNAILDQMNRTTSIKTVMEAVGGTVWPGRLQMVNLRNLTKSEKEVLLDGAHNLGSGTVLGCYVDSRLRERGSPITWIVGISRGKDAKALLRTFLRTGDNLMAVRFGSVSGMPWVEALEPDDIVEAGRLACPGIRGLPYQQHLKDSLGLATEVASGGRIVIAGSLYLVSDVLRLLRSVS